jgi:hypothetical protein
VAVNERDIRPHVTVFDKPAQRDGTFERVALPTTMTTVTFAPAAGPAPRNRHFTTTRSHVGQDGFIRYRARKQDCGGGGGLRRRCTPDMPASKVNRSIHEGLPTLPATSPSPTPT